MADNNPFPNENNTGHIWDDNIRELSNPPPSWWMIGFWASLAMVVIYGLIYPMWPLMSSYTKGFTGWTQMEEYKKSVAEVEAVRGEFEAQIAKMTPEQILADDGLSSYVEASTKVLFGDYCQACHGAGGSGGPSYPVLADDDWLYGGDVNTIVTTITNGRKGLMTGHGKILTDAELTKLAQDVIDRKVVSNPLYMQKGCVGCHGVDGKGLGALGSANLTDSVYRFQPEEGQTQLDRFKQVIAHGVNYVADPKTVEAVMPSFKDRLGENDIKKLAVYVSRLGGGQ